MGFRKLAKKIGRGIKKGVKKAGQVGKAVVGGALGMAGIPLSRGGGRAGSGIDEAPRASAAKLMRRQAGIGQVTTMHQEE